MTWLLPKKTLKDNCYCIVHAKHWRTVKALNNHHCPHALYEPPTISRQPHLSRQVIHMLRNTHWWWQTKITRHWTSPVLRKTPPPAGRGFLDRGQAAHCSGRTCEHHGQCSVWNRSLLSASRRIPDNTHHMQLICCRQTISAHKSDNMSIQNNKPLDSGHYAHNSTNSLKVIPAFQQKILIY